MKLRDCRFLADENIDPEVVRWLNALSVDIRSVNDLGLCGATDVDLLQIALAENNLSYLYKTLKRFKSAHKAVYRSIQLYRDIKDRQ